MRRWLHTFIRDWTRVVPSVFALLLLMIAVPRTVAAVLSISADDVIESLREGETPTDNEVLRAINQKRHAIRWWQDNQSWLDIGYARLVMSYDTSRCDLEMATLLSEARHALETGLGLNGAHPRGWLHLAIALWRQDRSDVGVLEALENSVLAGRYQEGVVIPRIELMLSLSPYMNGDRQAVLDDQIGFAWASTGQRGRDYLTALGMRRGAVTRLRHGLTGNEAAVRQFDNILRILGRDAA